MFQDGGQVGGDEGLALTPAEYHPAGVADARSDDLVRLTRRDHHDAVSAFQVLERLAAGVCQVAAAGQVALHQVHDHLGVGVGVEHGAFSAELLAQLEEVLHDAVVHHHHFPGHAQVGMGVARRGRAVGRPARVPDAQVALHGRFCHHLCQARQLAGVAADFDVPVFEHGKPGRVVAAVLQAAQAVQDDRRGITRSNVTNNSTHSNPSNIKFNRSFARKLVL